MTKTFKRGSGCFTCGACGKKTRDVNGQNGQLGLCRLCQVKNECGNALSDSCVLDRTGRDAWEEFAECRTVAECQKRLAMFLAGRGATTEKPRFAPKTNHGWGWSVTGAPECPSFSSQAEAARYVELRNDGTPHLKAWDRVEAERFAGAFGEGSAE